jgi:hypothetical protein
MEATLVQSSEKQIPRSLSPLARLRAARNDKTYFWTAGWATAGAAVWAGMAMLARMGIVRLGVIELLFLFAPLVIVPLGMELGRVTGESGWLGEIGWRLQPVGAGFAVVAMLLPPGTKAGLVALGWMLVCALMAGSGVMDLLHTLWTDAGGGARATFTIARIDLAVGGAWLVASRLGMRPMGIQEPIGLLTAVHFHFAGFATAMIASATLRFAERSGAQKWLWRFVLLVVLLPFVVAAGFVISPVLKMAAGMAFSASVAVLAAVVWKCAAQVEDGNARGFLRIAAGVVLVGMVLSGTYAVLDFVKSEALTIPRMASTHGVVNAMGFCLLGLLGWLVEAKG